MHLNDLTPIALARGLMEGDPKTFKAGYTAENAVLAVAERFKLSELGALELARELGADESIVRQCLS